jgi:hypothetical protein
VDRVGSLASRRHQPTTLYYTSKRCSEPNTVTPQNPKVQSTASSHWPIYQQCSYARRGQKGMTACHLEMNRWVCAWHVVRVCEPRLIGSETRCPDPQALFRDPFWTSCPCLTAAHYHLICGASHPGIPLLSLLRRRQECRAQFSTRYLNNASMGPKVEETNYPRTSCLARAHNTPPLSSPTSMEGGLYR